MNKNRWMLLLSTTLMVASLQAAEEKKAAVEQVGASSLSHEEKEFTKKMSPTEVERFVKMTKDQRHAVMVEASAKSDAQKR